MQKVKRLSIVSIGLMFICSSCGVMFGGSKYAATINVKDHPKAAISVNGQQIGKGSAFGKFPRNKALDVVVKEEGCEEYTQHFRHTFRGGNFTLSVIMWGALGVLVDLGTGASFKPAHNTDPNIVKMNDKNYHFIVNYEGCPITPTVTETSN
jgi:hypothetical protein